jgi:dihydrofolate reductase
MRLAPFSWRDECSVAARGRGRRIRTPTAGGATTRRTRFRCSSSRITLASRFTFVTDGIEAALAQASDVAGDKDVLVAGGASLAQQYLAAGLLDELQIHVVPLFLGDGVRLFDQIDPAVDLELTRVIESPTVTHLRYRVK